MNGPGHGGAPVNFPTVTIPQVLTAALGAAVYTCLAQRIGNYLLDDNAIAPAFLDIAVVTAIFLWNSKNLVDDYKAFDHTPDPEFNLWWTLSFSAAAYTVLAVASSSLFKKEAAAWGLVVYFSVLSLWSLVSFLRRTFSANRDKKNTDKESRRRRRGAWMLMYAACAIGTGVSLTFDQVIIFAAIIGVIYIVDCLYCKTFSTKNERQI